MLLDVFIYYYLRRFRTNMAIKKIEDSQFPVQKDSLPGVVLNIDNGDLKALQEVKEKWGFESESHALRFALAVMYQSKNNVVYIDRDGAKVGLKPGEDLLKKKEVTE